MRTLRFRSGAEMPALGLGTWLAKPGEVAAAVQEAVRIGYRHIDCAAIYGNEAEIGGALRELFDAGTVAREELWITSKLWCHRHGREDVVPALRESIAKLDCDYLDLYLVHWPVAARADAGSPLQPSDLISLDELPLEETWAGMEEACDLGLAKHIGVSNYSAAKLAGHLSMRIPPEMDQVELHPYLAQPKLLAFAKANGIHLTAYSPLGSRGRPDSMKGEDEPILLEDPVVTAIAARLEATPAQVLIAWALARGTAVIPKSVHPKRLAENFAAASIRLDSDAMDALSSLDAHRRYVTGTFWAEPGSPYTVAGLWDE